MILLCAFPLALLAIVAGMILLAMTKKDNLGNLYKYVSWFVIVMGALLFLCCGAHCAKRCMRCGEKRMMMKECRMMDDDDDDGYMMGHMGGMMGGHRGMGGCGMMMGGGCCGGGMMMGGGCCSHM